MVFDLLLFRLLGIHAVHPPLLLPMNLSFRAFATAALLLIACRALQAQPVNNNFANAIPLSGPTITTTGSNVGANKEFFEPNHGGNRGGASVWWTWTAPASGSTTIDTMGSDFNTLLGVYTGNGFGPGIIFTNIAGNDDYSGNTWSRVQFNAVAGTFYRIAVDGFRPGQFGGGPPPATRNIVLHIQSIRGLPLHTPPNSMDLTS